MHLLYCDETNLNPNDTLFFVYGGVIIPGEKAKSLHNEIEKIREEYSIPSEFSLKFNPKPENLSHKDFIKVKQSVIKATIKNNCIFITSIILHKIAKSPDEARRKEINRILYHFDCYLNRNDQYGLCLIDRFSDKQIDSHLREKFSIGLKGLPYSEKMRLENIIGFHYSAIGQSHFSSVIDIILGSFRYAINTYCSRKQDKQRLKAAGILLELIEPLFYRNDSEKNISELSLNYSPKVIKIESYRTQYQELKNFLKECGIHSSQEITDIRMY